MKLVALLLPVLVLWMGHFAQGANGDVNVPCNKAGGRCVAENRCKKIDKLNEGSCPVDQVCCKSDGVPENRGPRTRPVPKSRPNPGPPPPMPRNPRPPVYAKSGHKVTKPDVKPRARRPNPTDGPRPRQPAVTMCAGTEKKNCKTNKGTCKAACSSIETEIKNGCTIKSCKCCKKVCRKETCARGTGKCVKKKSDCTGTIKGSKSCSVTGSSKKCYCCVPGGTTKPPTSKPPTTKPPTSKPPTTKPPTSEPPTSKPPTTKPPTSEPPTSKPPTTKPPTSKPPTSEPPTSKPPTTKPPTTTAPTG